MIVRTFGSNVVKVDCLVVRSDRKFDFGVPFVSLIAYEVEAWDEKGRPLSNEAEGVISVSSEER